MNTTLLWNVLLVGALIAGCGDGGNGGTGGATSSGGAGGSGGATSSGGAGGTGGSTAPETVEVVLTKIGTPVWEIVDYHRFSVSLPTEVNPVDMQAAIMKLLPPPNHEYLAGYGTIPGVAHAQPYDTELGANAEKAGMIDQSTFTVAQAAIPNAVLRTFMVIPSANAPQGSSPDYDSGPIVPESLFPLHVKVSVTRDGVPDPALQGTINFSSEWKHVQALGTLDGHSHYPNFLWLALSPPDATVAKYGWTETMIDTEGNGWKMESTYEVVE